MTSSPFPRHATEDKFLYAAVILAAIVGVSLSAWLKPDPRGFGTHEQLGLLPCGFKKVSGLPCPTCGMTTSFSLMAHGRVFDAAHTQPFGAFLFIGMVAAAGASVRSLTSPVSYLDLFTAVRWRYFGPVIGLFFLLSWLYCCAQVKGYV